MRERILLQEGWLPSKKMARFARPQRTRWEETAKKEAEKSAAEHQSLHSVSSGPLVDLDCLPIPGGSRLWGVGELRGGGDTSAPAEGTWQWWIDELGLSDGQKKLLSLPGFLLDIFLADKLLYICHFAVDLLVGLPVLKFLTTFIFPPLLPTLREYPQVAGVSMMVAHWGLRLSKTVLASIFAGHCVAYVSRTGAELRLFLSISACKRTRMQAKPGTGSCFV